MFISFLVLRNLKLKFLSILVWVAGLEPAQMRNVGMINIPCTNAHTKLLDSQTHSPMPTPSLIICGSFRRPWKVQHEAHTDQQIPVHDFGGGGSKKDEVIHASAPIHSYRMRVAFTNHITLSTILLKQQAIDDRLRLERIETEYLKDAPFALQLP